MFQNKAREKERRLRKDREVTLNVGSGRLLYTGEKGGGRRDIAMVKKDVKFIMKWLW